MLEKVFPVLKYAKKDRNSLIVYTFTFILGTFLVFALPVWFFTRFDFFSDPSSFKIFTYFRGAGILLLGLVITGTWTFVNSIIGLVLIFKKKGSKPVA